MNGFSRDTLKEEDNGTQLNLRVQRVAVQLLYGRKVSLMQLRKEMFVSRR